MNWWTIVKQGKILTLPKTQLRIKKPEKVDTDDTCNKKLEEYANKVKGLKMHMKDFFNTELSNSKWNGLLQIKRDMTRTKQWSEGFAIEPSQNAIVGVSGSQYITEGGWQFEAKAWKYTEVPEKVACAALDLLQNAQFTGEYDSGAHKADIKEIDGWVIEIVAVSGYQHNELTLLITDSAKTKYIHISTSCGEWLSLPNDDDGNNHHKTTGLYDWFEQYDWR